MFGEPIPSHETIRHIVVLAVVVPLVIWFAVVFTTIWMRERASKR